MYRVPAENPIVWQQSLLDSEVSAILQGRYQERKKKLKVQVAKMNEVVERKGIDEQEWYDYFH